MGNQTKQAIYNGNFKNKKWQSLTLPFKQIPGKPKTVRTIDSIIVADQYIIQVNSKHQNFQRQKVIYQQRASSMTGHLVTIFSVQQITHQFQNNNPVDALRVRTQRMPWRLHLSKDLQISQALYILQGAVHGYYQILQHVRQPFIVTNQMIGINTFGRVRVWANPNFAINQIIDFKYKIGSIKAMLEQIILIVQFHVKGQCFPQAIRNTIFAPTSICDFISLMGVIDMLLNYSKEQKVQFGKKLVNRVVLKMALKEYAENRQKQRVIVKSNSGNIKNLSEGNSNSNNFNIKNMNIVQFQRQSLKLVQTNQSHSQSQNSLLGNTTSILNSNNQDHQTQNNNHNNSTLFPSHHYSQNFQHPQKNNQNLVFQKRSIKTYSLNSTSNRNLINNKNNQPLISAAINQKQKNQQKESQQKQKEQIKKSVILSSPQKKILDPVIKSQIFNNNNNNNNNINYQNNQGFTSNNFIFQNLKNTQNKIPSQAKFINQNQNNVNIINPNPNTNTNNNNNNNNNFGQENKTKNSNNNNEQQQQYAISNNYQRRPIFTPLRQLQKQIVLINNKNNIYHNNKNIDMRYSNFFQSKGRPKAHSLADNRSLTPRLTSTNSKKNLQIQKLKFQGINKNIQKGKEQNIKDLKNRQTQSQIKKPVGQIKRNVHQQSQGGLSFLKNQNLAFINKKQDSQDVRERHQSFTQRQMTNNGNISYNINNNQPGHFGYNPQNAPHQQQQQYHTANQYQRIFNAPKNNFNNDITGMHPPHTTQLPQNLIFTPRCEQDQKNQPTINNLKNYPYNQFQKIHLQDEKQGNIPSLKKKNSYQGQIIQGISSKNNDLRRSNLIQQSGYASSNNSQFQNQNLSKNFNLNQGPSLNFGNTSQYSFGNNSNNNHNNNSFTLKQMKKSGFVNSDNTLNRQFKSSRVPIFGNYPYPSNNFSSNYNSNNINSSNNANDPMNSGKFSFASQKSNTAMNNSNHAKFAFFSPFKSINTQENN